jgi:putative spermidine/putrescine transport system ATP-binding protein
MTTQSREATAPTSAEPQASPGLRLAGVGKELGGRSIVADLDLTVARGELVCLLGPSGCGKTTTLRMIAGFLVPDAGVVEIDGTDVTALPPERRPTAMVFQNYALWPHMSVFDNVAFGLKVRKVAKAEITERVEEMLELVNLTHHVRSRPGRISGGEQQRVALARALVQRPAVLLLDEPLSNLDAKLRVRVREDIRAIQQRLGITTVVVTHDQDEALSMSDRVAVMNAGRIEQFSTPTELYRWPATGFVGGFVGAMNTYPGTLEADVAVLAGGVRVPLDTGSAEGGTEIGVRPEDVVLTHDLTGTDASVTRVVPRGHFTEVVAQLAGAEAQVVRAYLGNDATSGEGLPEPGDRVRVRFRRALAYADGHLVR